MGMTEDAPRQALADVTAALRGAQGSLSDGEYQDLRNEHSRLVRSLARAAWIATADA